MTTSLPNFNLYITSINHVPNFHDKEITHLISIGDPASKKPYFKHYGAQPKAYRLEFHDLDIGLSAQKDYDTSMYRPPNSKDIQEIITIGNSLKKLVDDGKQVNLLSHCHAGQCRSTAAAYIILNILYGPGHENKCLNEVYHTRPIMIPNDLMVKFADELLNRDGKMLEVIVKYNKGLQEIV